jgi:hypothetical protein
MSVAMTLKRPRSPSPAPNPPPQPLPVRALPEAVWEDHLLPLLTCKEATRLARTCKALRVVVREHYAGDLGNIKVGTLRAALTTFPRARGLQLKDEQEEVEPEEQEALVKWLREGSGGGHLREVWWGGEAAYELTYTAVREGALPSLRATNLHLDVEAARALLTGGFLRGMHELSMNICRSDDPQLAALALVRQLPSLTRLNIYVLTQDEDDAEVQWPPFIRASLRALRIDAEDCSARLIAESLLHALPDMLEASGARIERLDVCLPPNKYLGNGLVHVAQVLRCCAQTLKGFCSPPDIRSSFRSRAGTRTEPRTLSGVDRLREQWAGVLAGVSACRELQVLVLPRIKAEPVFPPGTAFGRLTHLQISDHWPDRVREDAGVVGLWELVASGGLPALAKLSVRFEGECKSAEDLRLRMAEDMRMRVAPAWEAVAGTLTHLYLQTFYDARKWGDGMEQVGYELGVAVGKLRRLKELAPDLSCDGLFYDAVVKGLFASGGDPPLPRLWQVMLPSGVKTNADLVGRLLLPSVRVFRLGYLQEDRQVALLVACALQQALHPLTLLSIPHTFTYTYELEGLVRAIAPCRVGEFFKAGSWFFHVLDCR